jgi:HK97 gp10 family phage protein
MGVKGIDSAISKIRKLSQEAIQKMEDATELTAREIELKAKTLAPTDLGKLGQSIRAEKVTKLNWKIVAGGLIAPYAPFVEFGTGGMVSVPNEWKEIAIKFKGKGIKQVNLPAKPYMYPAFVEGRKKYLERLKTIIKRYGANK